MYQLFGSKLQDYYVRKLRALSAERRKRLERITTPEEFYVYQAEIREKIRKAFNLPTEKCELDPVITGTLTCPGFRVEKVIYHSRPHLPVTANLYIPDGAKNAPGVLFWPGHATNGKASDTYQTAVLNLVANGYVVLMPDPSGQGERSQIVDVPDSQEFARKCTREHNMINKQMLLVGEFYTSWFIWDVVRSFDYLSSRPEVNPERICVTGNSGGGNMSSFLTAVEPRLFAAAPSCYITRWLHNVENEEPACAEQEPEFLVGMGCDMGDLILAHAPRPTLILGQKNDFFDARGTRETYEEVKRIYDLLGASDRIRLFIGPTEHGYSRENRDAMYDFFNFIMGKGTPVPEDPERKLFTDEELQCTPTGQAARLPGEKINLNFAQELAAGFRASRKKLSIEELREKCRASLNIDERKMDVPYFRILKLRSGSGSVFSRFALETEENIFAILKHMGPSYFSHFPRDVEHSVLYVPHIDAQDEMQGTVFPEGCAKFGIDIRGIGEMMPSGCNYNLGHAQGEHLHPYHTDKFYSYFDNYHREFFSSYCYDYDYSAIGLMLGEPILGRRVWDILSAVKLMKSSNYGTIDLVAKGQGCIPALFAAVLSDDIAKVTLKRSPKSFEEQLQSPITYLPQAIMPTGILKFADISDLAEAAGATFED